LTEPNAVSEQTITPKKPRNKAARGAQIAIASIGVLALLLAGAYWAITWPRVPESGPAADVPAEYAPWTYGTSGGLETDVMWAEMNAALRAKDRDAFLSWATGDAVTQLGLWWDNTAMMGWDVAAISPLDVSVNDDGTQRVVLGAQYAFAAHPERGSGNVDADLDLIQGSQYTLTFEPTEDEGSSFDQYNEDGSLNEDATELPRITSMVPSNDPNPWDEGPVYVAKREHVVLVGMADESALVEATVDDAEAAAVTALDELREMGANLPQDGFVSVITNDDARFQRWLYGKGTPWEMDAAGFARPTDRPDAPASWLDPSIATGFDTSGTFVVVGPGSAGGVQRTFVHEYAHALHFTAAPGAFTDPPAAVMEGFARYFEWSAGVAEPRFTEPRIKEAIAQGGADAFGDVALRSQDANTAYEAAGSYYAFAASKGASAWELAVNARSGYGGLVGYSELHEGMSIPEWQAWVAAQ
jgi:hypothetical protein